MNDIETANLILRECDTNKSMEIMIDSTGDMLAGVSSSYNLKYDNNLAGIMTESEFMDIMHRLNSTIQDYWPCGPCTMLGCICYPCTYLPCFPTSICIGQVERHLCEYLERLELRPYFRERNIRFKLKKGLCKSFIVIIIPYSVWLEMNHIRSENTSPIQSLDDNDSNNNHNNSSSHSPHYIANRIPFSPPALITRYQPIYSPRHEKDKKGT